MTIPASDGRTNAPLEYLCPACVEIRSLKRTLLLARYLSDGFGSTWPAACPNCGAPMQVVRPGDCRCSAECEEER